MIEYMNHKKKIENCLLGISNEKAFNEFRMRAPRVLYDLSRLGKIYMEDDSKVMWNLFNLDKKAYENVILIEMFSINFKGGDTKTKHFLLLTTISLLIYDEAHNKVYLKISFHEMDKIIKLRSKELCLSYNVQKDLLRVNILYNSGVKMCSPRGDYYPVEGS